MWPTGTCVHCWHNILHESVPACGNAWTSRRLLCCGCRNVDADPKAVVALYEQYVALSQQHQELLRCTSLPVPVRVSPLHVRGCFVTPLTPCGAPDTTSARNQLSRQGLPPEELRELGRELKQTAARLDAEVSACRAQLEAEGMKLPVLSHEGTPVGDESAAITLRTFGDKPQFDFEAKGHLEIGTSAHATREAMTCVM